MKQEKYGNFEYSSNKKGFFLFDKADFQKYCKPIITKFPHQISTQTSSSISFLK